MTTRQVIGMERDTLRPRPLKSKRWARLAPNTAGTRDYPKLISEGIYALNCIGHVQSVISASQNFLVLVPFDKSIPSGFDSQ